MSRRTSPSANDPRFMPANAPGRFSGLVGALRRWLWPLPADRERGSGAEPVIEAVVPASAPDLHYLRRVAGSAGRWKRQIAEAQCAWPRASREELVATDGHVQRLVGLLQHHYALDPEEARARVLRFFAAQPR